ncbi:MAG: glycoside hydrolase family 127 protein, partial [Actinobacteria bacterium]|nr:glycoside hydrolase family 127 protein [Actinomycetota bacterium]
MLLRGSVDGEVPSPLSTAERGSRPRGAFHGAPLWAKGEGILRWSAIVAPDVAGIVLDTRRSPYARLRPVPIGAVQVDDAFWAPRLRTMRTVGLPAQYAQHEQTGRIGNFRRAAGRLQGPFQGRYYNDSDVYKWLEAASYALAGEPDPALDARVDRLSNDIAAAQQPDGYLNTYFTFERAAERYTDLANKHELYLAGHCIQAA